MARKVFFSFHYDDVTRANVVRNSDVITRQYQTGARFYDKSLWEEAKKHGPSAKRMIDNALNGSSVTCVLIGQQTWKRPWVRYEILKSLARGNGILGVQIHDVGFSPGDPSLPAGVLARQPWTARETFGRGTSPWQTPSKGPPASQVFGSATSAQPSAAGGVIGNGTSRWQTEDLPTLGEPIAPQLLAAGETFGRGTAPWQTPSNGLPASTVFGSGASALAMPSPGENPLQYLGYTINRYRGTVSFHELGVDNQWRQSAHVNSVRLTDLPWLLGKDDADNLASLFPVYGWKSGNGAKNFPVWVEGAARQVGR